MSYYRPDGWYNICESLHISTFTSFMKSKFFFLWNVKDSELNRICSESVCSWRSRTWSESRWEPWTSCVFRADRYCTRAAEALAVRLWVCQQLCALCVEPLRWAADGGLQSVGLCQVVLDHTAAAWLQGCRAAGRVLCVESASALLSHSSQLPPNARDKGSVPC